MGHLSTCGRRGLLSIGAAVALVAVGCVQQPGPAPTTSTTTTSEPTTSTTTSTTSTSTTSTTTTTTSTTTTTTTTAPPDPYTPLTLSCQTPNPLGPANISAFPTGVTTVVPATAAQGANFGVQMTADPMNIPTSGGGYPIVRLSNLVIRFDVPAGSSFVSATLSGGSSLGSGTPTVAESGGQIVMTVPGPLAPGSTAVLPTVNATMQATGSVGSTISARLAGTGYSDPGITFTSVVKVLFSNISANSSCYVPGTNPVLATTEIV